MFVWKITFISVNEEWNWRKEKKNKSVLNMGIK